MTTYSDLVSQYGGAPVVSAGVFAGWWSKKCWFADYANGTISAAGDRMDSPFKYIDSCVSHASADDAIFIRPNTPNYTGGDPNTILPYTSANIVIPYTKWGLSFIGTHPGSAGGSGHVHHRTLLAGHASAAATVPIFDVQATYTTFENLAFSDDNGSTAITVGSVRVKQSGVNTVFGTSFFNCMFRMFATATDHVGAIANTDAWYMDVTRCFFYRNKVSIACYGSSSTVRGLNVQDCVFQGINTTRAVDIQVMGSGGTYITIINNTFGAAPTAAGPTGTGTYIYLAADATGCTISGNKFDVTDAAAELVTIGDAIDGPNSDGGGWVA